jgi:hypothetical protein
MGALLLLRFLLSHQTPPLTFCRDYALFDVMAVSSAHLAKITAVAPRHALFRFKATAPNCSRACHLDQNARAPLSQNDPVARLGAALWRRRTSTRNAMSCSDL